MYIPFLKLKILTVSVLIIVTNSVSVSFWVCHFLTTVFGTPDAKFGCNVNFWPIAWNVFFYSSQVFVRLPLNTLIVCYAVKQLPYPLLTETSQLEMFKSFFRFLPRPTNPILTSPLTTETHTLYYVRAFWKYFCYNLIKTDNELRF